MYEAAKFGSLAQLVEQLTFNQLVVGSNPTRPTKFNALGSLLPGAFCYARFAALQCDFMLAAGNNCPPQ